MSNQCRIEWIIMTSFFRTKDGKIVPRNVSFESRQNGALPKKDPYTFLQIT